MYVILRGVRMYYLITYTNVNGYLIPNFTYKSGEQMEQLGKYGLLRRDYLKNHRNSTYQVMLLQDNIGKHLLEVDKAAREQEEAEKQARQAENQAGSLSGIAVLGDIKRGNRLMPISTLSLPRKKVYLFFI